MARFIEGLNLLFGMGTKLILLFSYHKNVFTIEWSSITVVLRFPSSCSSNSKYLLKSLDFHERVMISILVYFELFSSFIVPVFWSLFGLLCIYLLCYNTNALPYFLIPGYGLLISGSLLIVLGLPICRSLKFISHWTFTEILV